jgi:hypothetical protein
LRNDDREQPGLTNLVVVLVVVVVIGLATAMFAVFGGGSDFRNSVQGATTPSRHKAHITLTTRAPDRHATSSTERRTATTATTASPATLPAPTLVTPPATASPVTVVAQAPPVAPPTFPPTTQPRPVTTQHPASNPFCAVYLPATVPPGHGVYGSLVSNRPNAPFTLTMSGKILDIYKTFTQEQSTTDGTGSASVAMVNLSGAVGSRVTIEATFASTSCSSSYTVVSPTCSGSRSVAIRQVQSSCERTHRL